MHTLATSIVGNPARFARFLVTTASIGTVIGAIIWTSCIVAIVRRDVRRSRNGWCLQCGYDLSHSTDRCPECGATIRK